jgi:hypothetical protein
MILRRNRRGDSGQAVLLGVTALLLVAVSLMGGMRLIGPKFTLHQQQTGGTNFLKVQKALWSFVARNYRLPCPADGTVAQGTATDGLENCGLVGLASDAVPWKTIGLTYTDSLDGFGSRIGYAPTSALASPTTSTPYKSAIPSSDATKVTVSGTATNYAYVLISYGSDRAGAYLPSGARVTLPTSSDETANTNAAAFNGGAGFFVYPFNNSSSAGNAYFDDMLVYETSTQICNDVNGTLHQISNGQVPSGASICRSTGPALASQNTSNAAIAARAGTAGYVYSCSVGSGYCPGSTNAGSLANVLAFNTTSGSSGTPCSGNVCTAAPSAGGSCASLYLVGSLGTVTVCDPIWQSGIAVGNSIEDGDWVGPNHNSSCSQCAGASYTPNYLVPTQTLTYGFANSYYSFAFVDYLVDGGMQVQVDAYAGTDFVNVANDSHVGTVIVSNSNQINIPVSTPFTANTVSGSASLTSASTTTGLAVGQPVAGPGLTPGSVITAISGSTLTLSQNATITQAGPSFTGNTSLNSSSLISTSPTTGLAVGQVISGPGVNLGTTVSAISGTTITLSQSATATQAGASFSAQPTFYALSGTLLTSSITGTTNSSTSVTSVSSIVGLAAGQAISGVGIPTGTTIAAVSGTTITLSQAATATAAGVNLFVTSRLPITGITGTLSTASKTISAVSSTTGIVTGDYVESPGVPSGSSITAVTANSITISQTPTVNQAGALLGIASGTPISAITGTLTSGSNQITAVANASTLLAVGEFIENVGLNPGTTITAISGTTVTISSSAIASGTATLIAGYTPPATAATMTANTTSGSASVTNLPAGALPGVGQSLYGADAASGADFQTGTIVSAVAGSTVTINKTAVSTKVGEAVYGTYAPCPGPGSTAVLGAGLYATPNGYQGVSGSGTTAAAPYLQHPSKTIASGLTSEIWPQPANSTSGLGSASSNPNGLSGNYVDQRDNQFGNLQFLNSSGTPQEFNILVFQVLPYTYTDTASNCAGTVAITGPCRYGNTQTYAYGMLFEGVKGCTTDAFTADCSMQGSDEWWNPPVTVTMDCAQRPS